MITLTESASEKFKQLTGRQFTVLRVEVVRGPHGCVHALKFATDTEGVDDPIVYESEGVRIVAEPEVAQLIDNAPVDYSEDATSGGFTIDAPLAVHCEHDGSRHG